jgi:polar amino acid transport system permease protein
MTGVLDWDFIGRALPAFGEALLLTAGLGAGAVGGALLAGAAGALLLRLRVPALRGVIGAYIEFSRNTPLLAQLFFLYFGLPAVGIRWSGFTCALAGLVFLGGGYMVEAFRAGIEAVGRPQIESALSLGLSRAQTVRHVVLPQALATAMPALGANCVFLLRETSVVGCIAVADLTHLAQDLIGLYYKTTETLLLLVAAYLALVLPLSFFFKRIEKTLRHAGFGEANEK